MLVGLSALRARGKVGWSSATLLDDGTSQIASMGSANQAACHSNWALRAHPGVRSQRQAHGSTGQGMCLLLSGCLAAFCEVSAMAPSGPLARNKKQLGRRVLASPRNWDALAATMPHRHRGCKPLGPRCLTGILAAWPAFRHQRLLPLPFRAPIRLVPIVLSIWGLANLLSAGPAMMLSGLR